MIVKENEWHGSDYLITWKMDEAKQKLACIGWLPKQQVETVPITPKGESIYTPYASGRVIDLADLHDPNIFLKKLNEK